MAQNRNPIIIQLNSQSRQEHVVDNSFVAFTP